jgi:hypothetical protein
MRTIRSLTERDSPLWRSNCPMLDGLSRAIPSMTSRYGTGVSESNEADGELSASELAQLAFGLFQLWSDGGGEIDEESASDLLAAQSDDCSRAEISRVAVISENMKGLGVALDFRSRPAVHVALRPCGVIESAHCDTIWEDHLVEFKAVNRNFGVRDLRQLVLYCCLAWLDSRGDIVYATLANPLRGEYVSMQLDDLAAVISGTSFSALSADIADHLIALGVST